MQLTTFSKLYFMKTFESFLKKGKFWLGLWFGLSLQGFFNKNPSIFSANLHYGASGCVLRKNLNIKIKIKTGATAFLACSGPFRVRVRVRVGSWVYARALIPLRSDS